MIQLTQGSEIITQDEFIQGSLAWKSLRKTKITASDAGTIMGLNPYMDRQALLEEKCGIRPEREITYRMQRGQLLEPVALKKYEDFTGNLMVPLVKINPFINWMMASLDGISIDQDLIIEIKCTHAKNHAMARSGKIPEYYYPQIQHQLCVCDIDLCHYYSFDGVDGVVVPVFRDKDFISRMIDLEFTFYEEMMKLKQIC